MSEKPEDRARRIIDEKLTQVGWKVQRFDDLDLTAELRIAVAEFPLRPGFGRADYLLYVARRAVGVVEAKPEGVTLTGVEVQREKHGEGLSDKLPKATLPLPYLYQSTGVETRFMNALYPAYLTPETLAAELNLSILGLQRVARVARLKQAVLARAFSGGHST